MKKYSEQIIRHQAINEEGKPREILERITFERAVQADGSLGEASVFNRRFDLQTGEPLARLSETEFEVCGSEVESNAAGTRWKLTT